MKRLLSILLAGAMLVAMTGLAQATIGWAGQIWPVNGTTVSDNANVDVYFQIWKGGVTDQPGQGPMISATLYYGPNAGPYTSVAMTYNTDVGNNDEYKGTIPSIALQGVSEIWFYCDAYDESDATTYTGAQDQAGNNPPFKLNVTQTLSKDVTVTFFLCMPPLPGLSSTAVGAVCITGDHPELTNWGSGVTMMQPCPAFSDRFYQVSVVFPAGSNPYVQYKYRRDDCVTWESTGNHTMVIDDSSPVFYLPWVDHWEYYTGSDCPLCGVGVQPTTWGEIKEIYR